MSIVNRYELKGEKLSFHHKRNYFIDNYPNTIHLYLLGSWFKVFNEDAGIINNIMDYKLFKDKYKMNICCGFPERSLGRLEYYFDKYKINYNIINVEKDTYELHDFEEENSYLNYISKNSNEKVIPIDEDEIVLSNKYVEIGDTVIIKNLRDNIIETFTIKQAYYEAKPIGINKGKYAFGTIKYKYDLIDHSDIETGKILSDSPFAQVLLGLREGEIFITKDEEAEDSEYQVIDIKKGE